MNLGKTIGRLVLILVIGFGLGWFIKDKTASPASSQLIREVRVNPASVNLVNPLLYIRTTEDTTSEYKSLKKTINDYVNSSIKTGKASGISVYVREMDTGMWTGVNESTLYEPSSMLKVLVMMSYLKAAEENPDLFNKTLYYSGKEDPGQFYKPTTKLAPGHYSIPDLIKRTIIESDNEAVSLLTDYNPQVFTDTYKTLELPPAPTAGQPIVDFMSPRAYSVLFRTLYNATYLSARLSEQALELMTETTFKSGLEAGVPARVVVAHKFGEHTDITEDGKIITRELHDCGIVYKQDSPYFLCVMTKGNDFKNLEGIISDISKMVYAEALN
ncbi:class A beta-lactamase-related serine hydrolase [Candidatus Parcubacteria bacterium]|nr:class A beta-lactamase-related serine hydrolase [Candidatus Parcubacteria bacterium]